jgi:hypothetical protein
MMQSRVRFSDFAAIVALTALSSGCAGSPPEATEIRPAVSTAEMNAEIVREVEEGTALNRPMVIRFDWSLKEEGAVFSGKGVSRIAPPYRARVDLFGPRGDAYLSAALVDSDLRVPGGVTDKVPLPPAPLFWSVLGVFRAPAGAVLKEATRSRDGHRIRLIYTEPGSTWTFDYATGKLRHAEWQNERTGKQTVDLVVGDDAPEQASYRDWPAFRELTLKLTEAGNSEAHPDEIWTPGTR